MKTYALLVGINDYPMKPLRGCINDVMAVEKFLLETYQPEQLAIKKLIDAEATRQGLIDAFSWFDQAQNGDTCLFYYSGHGSYMTAAKEFWTETDGNLETLVCFDSRVGDGRDLANKELGFLIWQHTRNKTVNFVVITDSCHSGSVTRELFEMELWSTDRTAPTKSGITPVEDFYGFNMLVNGEKGYTDNTENGVRKVSIAVADHIHLAASRDNQTAKENEIQGEHRGIFSYSLLRTLYANNAQINYQNLIASTDAKVKSWALEQDPSLNIIGLEDSARLRLFLDDTILKNSVRLYKVFKDINVGWSINGGGINDFQMGDKVEIIGKGMAQISDVSLDNSTLKIPSNMILDDQEYDAKVIKSKKISVGFSGSIDAITKEKIKELAKNATDFIIVNTDTAKFYFQQKKNQYFLSSKDNSWALFKKINKSSANALTDLVDNTDTVCRWYLLQELINPRSEIKANEVEISVEEIGAGIAKDSGDGYGFYYQFDENTNKWKSPKLQISLKNKSNITKLIVKPIYLGFDYNVDTSAFGDFEIKDEPENIRFTNNGQTTEILPLSIDKKYRDLGYNQITEYLKIFVSTKKLETDNFFQEGIELEEKAILEADRMATNRVLGIDPDEDETIDDWQVFTLKLTVTRPTDAELGANENKPVFGLNFENSSDFSAKIGFSTTIELKQRGLRGVESPTLLNETKGNDIFTPAQLVPNHGQGQSLNVIEIFDAQNPDSVKYETPLIITPSEISNSDETIIPFGFDPETNAYFPLGYLNKEGKIIINQLPPETPSDALITQRSFLGSIKIYFYKIIGQKIGLKYDYPQLSKVTVDEREKVTYEKDLETIKNAVATANKIVVFIHGIIGDTEEMTKAVRRAKTPNDKFLIDEFDLVLAFDYENLNTKIQETALDLKNRLLAVGLGENHGKELVIIAHSMGGLVSRYFIEKLDGNKVVNHLIMLGTPNGGSEWADVRDIAETLLTVAVNGAPISKVWMIPLSFIGKIVAGTQITLQQMNNTGNLSIISKLNDGTIPTTKYSIIAGNTKLLGNSAKIESALKRVIARLREKPAYEALDLVVFQNEPNDIAVKVRNIKKINQVIPDIFEVASDHISYFGEAESLAKLGSLF